MSTQDDLPQDIPSLWEAAKQEMEGYGFLGKVCTTSRI